MTIAVDPRNMTVEAWAAETTRLINSHGIIPKLVSEARWKAWAAYVASLPAIAAVNAARPEPYANWRDWAQAFNVAVRLLPG